MCLKIILKDKCHLIENNNDFPSPADGSVGKRRGMKTPGAFIVVNVGVKASTCNCHITRAPSSHLIKVLDLSGLCACVSQRKGLLIIMMTLGASATKSKLWRW